MNKGGKVLKKSYFSKDNEIRNADIPIYIITLLSYVGLLLSIGLTNLKGLSQHYVTFFVVLGLALIHFTIFRDDAELVGAYFYYPNRNMQKARLKLFFKSLPFLALGIASLIIGVYFISLVDDNLILESILSLGFAGYLGFTFIVFTRMCDIFFRLVACKDIDELWKEFEKTSGDIHKYYYSRFMNCDEKEMNEIMEEIIYKIKHLPNHELFSDLELTLLAYDTINSLCTYRTMKAWDDEEDDVDKLYLTCKRKYQELSNFMKENDPMHPLYLYTEVLKDMKRHVEVNMASSRAERKIRRDNKRKAK